MLIEDKICLPVYLFTYGEKSSRGPGPKLVGGNGSSLGDRV